MSDFKNSTLRSHALDIQSQTGVKYTEALRQATRDIHVVDNSVEDYSDPSEWADDQDYYKMLTTFDTLASELIDVLPKLHTVLGEPWLLTREESDSVHINPRTDICYCFDVVLLDEKDRYSSKYVAHDLEALSPRLYRATPTDTFGAYEAQAQMVSLKDSSHSRIYFQSNWDWRKFVYDFTGLSLSEKKSAFVELFNVTLREVILDHLSRCVEETARQEERMRPRHEAAKKRMADRSAASAGLKAAEAEVATLKGIGAEESTIKAAEEVVAGYKSTLAAISEATQAATS